MRTLHQNPPPGPTERYRSIFLSSPVAIYEVTADGRIGEANPAAADLTGRCIENLKGTPIVDLVSDEDVPRIREGLQRTLSGEGLEFTVTLQTPHNGPRTIYGVSIPTREEGKVDRVFATARDVTEEYARQNELAHLGHVLDAIQQAVIVTDADQIVTYVNRHAERLYGWTAEELKGQPVTVLVPPDQEHRAEAIIRQVDEGMAWMGDFTVRRKDGSTFTALIQDSPVVGPDGVTQGFVRTSVDVTRQREREKKQRQEQKMADLGRLAGGVAHDFNNLLTAIEGYVSLLQDDPTLARRMELDEIQRTARRGAALTARLLDYSGRNGRPDPRAPIDVGQVVMEAGELLDRLIGEHIQIEYHLSRGLQVLGDPDELEQILMNLAVNARDSMVGGGALTIDLEPFHAPRTYSDGATTVPAGRYARLRVRDTGIGMDPEVRDHIFEPFFSTKARGEGTGLGLYNVMSIIEGHGGRIALSSEPGYGTEFRIYLPLHGDGATSQKATRWRAPDGPRQHGAAEGRTDQARAPEPPGWDRPRGILVVDDEPALLSVTCRILEREGYRTLSADSGAEALATVAEEREAIAVAIVDLGLPDMRGEELRARLLAAAPEMPVVLTSGRALRDIEEVITDPDRTGALAKPYTPKELTAAVDARLEEGSRPPTRRRG